MFELLFFPKNFWTNIITLYYIHSLHTLLAINKVQQEKNHGVFLHPGKLTWNLKMPHLERKMIFQTSMIMFHVNLQGCNSFYMWKTSQRKLGFQVARNTTKFPDSRTMFFSSHFHKPETCCETRLPIATKTSLNIAPNINIRNLHLAIPKTSKSRVTAPCVWSCHSDWYPFAERCRPPRCSVCSWCRCFDHTQASS